MTADSSRPSALRIAVIGGGAAGFFSALAAAEAAPTACVTIFEATAQPLAKVRISGGGRCNVTHACFEPRELITRYPRGGRELLGPLHRFGPRETVAWFAARGVELKTEADGRMFPVTDDSATIVGALTREAERRGIAVRLRCGVRGIHRAAAESELTPTHAGDGFELEAGDGGSERYDRVILATGGARGAGAAQLAAALGHTIEPPVPSLFTFHIDDSRLRGLEGLAVPDAATRIAGQRLQERGALLVTHWGLSGPAILKLSAWGARLLAASDYRFDLHVTWVAGLTTERARADLTAARRDHARKLVQNVNPWALPARLWERCCATAEVAPTITWATVSNAALQRLAAEVVDAKFSVNGKSLNKEEFVTCGGVRLREIDFRTMQSRLVPHLYFAGEVLDIDGVTGGFNFQAAWTTGWIAGRAAAEGG